MYVQGVSIFDSFTPLMFDDPLSSCYLTLSSLSVKFLVFPAEAGETPPPCGAKGNCSVPTPLSFLSKNPVNQTGNITAGKKNK